MPSYFFFLQIQRRCYGLPTSNATQAQQNQLIEQENAKYLQEVARYHSDRKPYFSLKFKEKADIPFFQKGRFLKINFLFF